jgi:hypothetical protein
MGSTRFARFTAVAALTVAAASSCGGRTRSQRETATLTPHYLSATQHEVAAQEHDRAATERERALAGRDRTQEAARSPAHCFDQPIEIPGPDLGGEPVRVLRPCWTGELRPAGALEREAMEHRREAARHRAIAGTLRRVERESCAGLGQADTSHSPFFHRDDIAAVDRIMVEGELRGARVLFRKVAGLDAPWMRRAIFCHQARAAAMGYAPDFMSYCPLMIAPTFVSVEETARGIEVSIRARRDVEAAAIYGRARDLLEPTVSAR